MNSMCVLHRCTSRNMCVHVWAESHVCFANDAAQTAVTEVECGLWIVYACMWVWVPDWCILMVLLHAVAEHWGVTWKSVRELSVLPDTFSTWGKKEGMDRFFLYWQGFSVPVWVQYHTSHQHEGGCVLVCPLYESPHCCRVRTVSQTPSAAMHASFYLVL